MQRNHSMRLAVCALVSFVLFAAVFVVPPAARVAAANTTYYVDSADGSDSNAGTSSAAPWKSIAKVNAKTNYQPGDQILFKAGGSWTGSVAIRNSGASGNPIVIGSYGTGPKPIINANAAYAAINLENVQYITLQDLELTNFKAAAPDDYLTGYYRRSGIWIKAFHQGPMHDITIRNMDIHDVTGMSLNGETTVTTTDGKDKDVNKNANAAIQINAWEWETGQPLAYFDNLVIEDNYIHDVSTMGININAASSDKAYFNRNVVISGNTILNNGADAICVGVTSNPLIEYNVSLDAGGYGHGYKWIAGMWVWRTDGATFQHNEVGRVHYEGLSGEADSAAFDTDIATSGDHIYQYNYSHDNEGGFIMDMGRLQNGSNIIRYNISQNDKHNGNSGMTINTSGDTGLIYNNVFYNDIGTGLTIRNNPKVTYTNNIFYVTGGGSEQYPALPKFHYNAFYGQTAPLQGVKNIVGDPGFVAPGEGADGIGTVLGYKLRANSPLLGAGTSVAANGGRDFWNNPLYTGTPDIGVFEDPTSTIDDTVAPAAPTSLAVSAVTDESLKLTWQAAEGGVPLDADIYDADTDGLIASVKVANEYTVSGLTPNTLYSFYVVAKDPTGNASSGSATVQATTNIAVTVDNAAAAVTGSWTAATGGFAYQNDYVRIAAGTGANTVTWTPNLPEAGYYSVYYYLPDGSVSRAGNAKYTVSGAGGTKTYAVDQRPTGGAWKPLGIHRFASGTSGSVQVSDNANGEVAADAVKWIYHEGLGLEDIVALELETEKRQLRLGESMSFAVYGVDAAGNRIDLTADGASIGLVSDHPAVADRVGGRIEGEAQGTAQLTASFTYGGNTLTSNAAEVIVGEAFIVESPVFTDASGQVVNSAGPGVVTASVTILNSSETHKRAVLVAAVYTPDGLASYWAQEAVIQKYDNNTLQASVAVPNQPGSYVKVFVWDSMAFKRPLTESAELH
ncbi:golvesin C-terminal-like domain-containing protein [Paenibacillus cymbidii]|uniref:golvesin C-terminal-like domain-containing protein n=1 Tax=Paenibacillus cymbidii TaxID=1639034 RepID=UPI0014367313|nr:right-handed parallel beta-helix repeat-containing protein [Paenibacillus cymbidii]